jgi:hypothetical protein
MEIASLSWLLTNFPPRKTPQPGALWVVEKTTKEVYITKYPKRDRWFTNLSNKLKHSGKTKPGACAEA